MNAATPPRRSFLLRTVAAVGLWMGFYVVGFGLVALLLVLPWTQLHVIGQLDASGWWSGVGALWVLWAVFPRIRRRTSDDPPSVPETEQPRLWAFVRAMSARAGQPPPDRLLLFPEVNAFARLDRRGLRRVRVVGLGLPLFSVLDQEGLAAVLLHELGHHHAGDVALGPWLWRARAAIGGALERLDGSAFWLHLPFVAYGRLFLKVTAPLGRAQELAADELAARIVGVEATARALRLVDQADIAWDAYFAMDVQPVLRAGRRPPLLEGFATFRGAKALRTVTMTAIERGRARAATTHAHATHPTLAERLAALAALTTGASVGEHHDPLPSSTSGSSSAIDVLIDVDRAERRAIDLILTDPSLELPPIAWERVADDVLLPSLRERIEPLRARLSAFRLEQLPEALEQAPTLWAALRRDGVSILSAGAQRRIVGHLLLAWVVDQLVQRGFRLHVAPGHEHVLVREGEEFAPEPLIEALVEGTCDASAWRAFAASVTAAPDVA